MSPSALLQELLERSSFKSFERSRVYMLNRDCTRYLPIVLTFIAGYGVIVLEEVLEIHKTATALILGVMVCLGQMDST